MKKIIVALSLALALGLAYSATAANSITGNAFDDGSATIISAKFASLKIKIKGVSVVQEYVENTAASGGSFVACGEDCQDVTLDSGNATATTDSGLEVGTVEVKYDGLSTSNSGTISGNSGDDPALLIVENETTKEKVSIDTYENVDSVVVAGSATGGQFVAAGDDATGIVVKTGTSGSILTRLAAIGVKLVTRYAP
ncbi:MAG: hypothetical protein WC659_00780 [Patescibacteria group bacterium]